LQGPFLFVGLGGDYCAAPEFAVKLWAAYERLERRVPLISLHPQQRHGARSLVAMPWFAEYHYWAGVVLSKKRWFAHSLFLATLIFSGLLSASTTYANEDDVATLQKFTPQGRHRIDLSYTHYDSFAGEASLLLPAYTWAPRQHLRFSVTGSYVSNDLPANPEAGFPEPAKNTGIGDTIVGIQYDPSSRLTASPWVPDSVGLAAQLLAPTGDADQGLSGDSWFASFSAGWAIDSISRLWLIPAIGYEFTFNEGKLSVPTNQPYTSLDFVWLFRFGGWLGVTPRIGYEFEEDKWAEEIVFTAGKMFAGGFGLSLDYGNIEQLSAGVDRDDRQWLLNLYYQFGNPPGRPD